MNTLEYLDAAKKQLGVESDYALSKALKVRASTITGYRTRGGQMDDDVAGRIAEILKIHPGLVMLDMHRARAKTPSEASIWQDIYAGFRVPSLQAKTVQGTTLHW